MNLMDAVINNLEYCGKNKTIKEKVTNLQKRIKKEKAKFSDKNVLLGNMHYYNNCLPIVNKDRDVLRKPEDSCKVYVNWKKKPFTGLSTSEVMANLKEQWGWSVTTVDANHTRNNFKNKEELYVVFDTFEEAEKMRKLFNAMFITAIELDCIEEYKRFKENPEKRILSFDKLVSNAYELYEDVDNGKY